MQYAAAAQKKAAAAQKRLDATAESVIAKKAKTADAGLAVLLSKPEMVSEFRLRHVTDSYGKKDATFTRPLSYVHIIARFLNDVGINGKTTVADVKKHVQKHLGTVPNHVDRWLEQQSGGNGIGGIKIKNPKITLTAETIRNGHAVGGQITVLRLFKARG